MGADTQVARILAPIAQCMDGLDAVWANPKTRPYIESEHGSLETAKLEILSDFFKHGFDGDGDDGGSCIDGRLTRWAVSQPRIRLLALADRNAFSQRVELVLEDREEEVF